MRDLTPAAPAPQTALTCHRRHWLYGLAASALWPAWAADAMAATAAPQGSAQAPVQAPATLGGTALPLRVLLLGNASYRHNAALANPPRDVALLAQAFQARGAQVRTLANLSAQAMEAAVRQFLQDPATRSSALWLGYSGHAVQIDGRNYLQGVDSDFSTPQRVREYGLNLDLLLGLIERARPPAAVVAIDACRNNPFEPERTRGLSIGLAAQEPRGLCLSFSTAPYTKALDGDEGQYSPYALALAQALSGQQNKPLDKVLRETADSVYRGTRQRQIPEYRSALRSEWWFGARSVSLLDSQGAAQQPGTSTASRSSSYRPDEPAVQERYQQRNAASWTQQDQQLQLALHRMSDAQVQTVLRTTAQGGGDEHQRLLAAMVWEDGHPVARKQPAAARQLLLPLASQGHALAQTLLGESFYAARDYGQAYKWLSLAARSNYPRAHTDLGQLIAEGRAEGDPTAGALQMLRGMLEQGRAMQMPGGPPSPEVMEQAEQLRRMLQGR